jgi:hypothetical protein
MIREAIDTRMKVFAKAVTAQAPPEKDTSAIGLVFIDVLFGAVVAKAFDVGTSTHRLPAAGWSQLALAVTVTITSWIGYHNSSSRSRYRILFFNLPLIQFTIEVAHLVAYWLLVTSSEQSYHFDSSALPGSFLLAVIFMLYCAWDYTALHMRKSTKYEEMKPEDDRPSRRRVTQVFTAIFVLITVVVIVTKLTGAPVVVVDMVMILLVVCHRWLQNVFQGKADDQKAPPTS